MNGRKITIYQYPPCSTCRDAVKWLKGDGLELESIHMFETPPSAEELKVMIPQSGLDIRKWFNVNGEVYREMNLKDQLPDMSRDEMIDLLASNGRLIKRPVVTDGKRVTVGYKPETYSEVWHSES
jgi:arsenate reductase